MPFSEGSIGKGTIRYQGEDPDYWWRKSALWRPRRTAITVGLLVVGLLLLGYAASPLSPRHATARVLDRTVTAPVAGSEDLPVAHLRLRVAGGRTVTVDSDDPVVVTDVAYAPGQVLTVTSGGAGSTRLGADDVLWPWMFGGLLVLVAVGRALWDRRTADRLHYFR